MNKNKILPPIFISTMVLFYSNSVHAEDLNDLKSKKNNLVEESTSSQENKEKLENELTQVETSIGQLETTLSNLTEQMNLSKFKIKQKEELITSTQKQITQISSVILQKENELSKKKSKLKQNLQLMYSNGNVQFLEFLFRSDNLSQFLFRYDQYKDIMNKGEELHNEVLKQIDDIKQQKGQLQVKQLNLETVKKELEEEQDKQQEQRKQQRTVKHLLKYKKKQVQEEIEQEEAAMNELANSIAKVEKDIEQEKQRIVEAKRIAEEKKRQEELQRLKEEQSNSISQQNTEETENTGNYVNNNSNNSILASPMVPGTYRISSPYGYRVHPITGKKKLHNGVDFAAPRDTPIYAMEEGYVLYAGKANGYGNWIVIKHPNGLYTIYGHMYDDGLYVKPGEYVFKGQKIGGVGSNGGSTGNHLHFCVATSFNGSTFTYDNPMNYISLN